MTKIHIFERDGNQTDAFIEDINQFIQDRRNVMEVVKLEPLADRYGHVQSVVMYWKNK